MTALAEKLTVEAMVQHPEKWENYELYRGEPIEMTPGDWMKGFTLVMNELFPEKK